MDPHRIIKYPLSTEKAMLLIDTQNKLVFVVDRKATKQDIKDAIEKLFKVKVKKINTFIANDGKKHAYVKFPSEVQARDIATQLGLI